MWSKSLGTLADRTCEWQPRLLSAGGPELALPGPCLCHFDLLRPRKDQSPPAASTTIVGPNRIESLVYVYLISSFFKSKI